MNDNEKGFLEFLDKVEEEKERIVREGQALEEKLRRERQEKIQENLLRGIECAKKIYSWGYNFFHSEAGKKAMSLVVPTKEKDKKVKKLVFFSIKGRRYNLPSLSFRDDAPFGYCGRIVGSNEPVNVCNGDITLSSPECLASFVESEILKQIWESIESGAVYQKMQEMLKLQLMDWKRISHSSTL